MLPPRLTGTEKGHGRIDTRTIPGWPVSPGIGFPYAQPAARLTRGTVRPHRTMDSHPHRRTVTEVPTRETVYLLTRRSPEEAGPAALWALARHHWSIEAMPPIEEVSFHADAHDAHRARAAHVTTRTRWARALLRHRHALLTVPDAQRYWVTHPREFIAQIA